MGVGRAPLPARAGGRVAFPPATPLSLSNHPDLAAFKGLWTPHLEEQRRLLPRCLARRGMGVWGR